MPTPIEVPLRSKRQRRVLRVTADGVSIAGRPFKARRLVADWKDLKSIDVGPRYAVVATRAGRTRRLDLADLEQPDLVRHALLQAEHQLASRRSSGASTAE